VVAGVSAGGGPKAIFDLPIADCRFTKLKLRTMRQSEIGNWQSKIRYV